MKGWVYIITNKAMPDLLKVGFSTKDPESRANELHTTGVPHRFVVEYDALVNDPYVVEQKAHKFLKVHHESKEWFRCDISTAVIAIREAANGSIILESKKHSLLGESSHTIEPESASEQNKLGDLYRYGNSTSQDYSKAFNWYLKAAEQGNAYAQNSLGDLYKDSLGVTRDYSKAFVWYQRAAKQGYSVAQCNLGDLYKIGL